ncbi:hypothetical protein ILYODFUR_001308 [Ilyodon furcidens]|uniref:Uncharacterized protein n=1 Tax=Ilyodon furcidens TaxID=33524 RepID=A0ABV0U4H7_9TELE
MMSSLLGHLRQSTKRDLAKTFKPEFSALSVDVCLLVNSHHVHIFLKKHSWVICGSEVPSHTHGDNCAITFQCHGNGLQVTLGMLRSLISIHNQGLTSDQPQRASDHCEIDVCTHRDTHSWRKHCLFLVINKKDTQLVRSQK